MNLIMLQRSNKGLLGLSSYQSPMIWTFIRTMKSVNTRKKKPMHIMRAKLMKVTEWREKPDYRPAGLLCDRIAAKKIVEVEPEENLALEFEAREFYKLLSSSKMVAVFHNNGINMQTKTNLQKKLMKANIQVHIIANDAAKLGTDGTEFANMQRLFIGSNLYAVSDKPNVKELLKATRKVPSILLIGGLLENQLMSFADLEQFGSLPSLDIMQSQIVSTLSSSISTTSRYLQTNQQMLAANLSQLESQKQQ
ncbi:large ribosomal subunit protein uL10m-like isoform X2 [Antedon mediterranea]|uniref:large ribosomal subunit protein uL10m-like isoform X2 n=1 Tax=Antedon mediterranea TaxID=105859 RepID=UPI003AF9824B